MIPFGGINSAAIATKDATRKEPMANKGFVLSFSIGLCLCRCRRMTAQTHDRENLRAPALV